MITSNINNITKHACLDLTGNETTWEHTVYGEAGSGITRRTINNPGISKGGQVISISDFDIIRPRAYIHIHKLYEMPDGGTLKGQCEACYIIEQLTSLVEGEPAGPEVRKIFKENFHSTWDKKIWLRNYGLDRRKRIRVNLTCRCDCLTVGVLGQYSN